MSQEDVIKRETKLSMAQRWLKKISEEMQSENYDNEKYLIMLKQRSDNLLITLFDEFNIDQVELQTETENG